MFRIATCFLLYFLIPNHVIVCVSRINPLVQTKQGLVRGVRPADGNYSMFLGIPFATVENNNPFGPSIPYSKFDDIFEANDESAVCPQYDTNERIIGTLDCLHLNVFTPDSINFNKPLPVLVWIYGGGFERGSYRTTKLGPSFLMEHDVIVVAFNYRVGPYGFMCLDTPEVPGNAGLKDQLLALRWIKDNIEFFGGDVNRITLAGQSAGSVAVDLHLLFDKEVYFNQVILNSGTAQCPWATIDSDRDEPIQLAKIIGYTTEDMNDAMSFLSRAEPASVIAAKRELGTVSRPCVEKRFAGVENFITDYPINMEIPRAKITPILVGYTDDELVGEYIKFPRDFFEDPNLFTTELSLSFDFGAKAKEMADFYKHFYTGDVMGEESKFQIIDFESDFRFNHPTQRSINSYLDSDAKNIYQFLFTYQGDRNVKLTYNVTVGGASHGDQMPYIFDYEIFRDFVSQRDKIMIDRMSKLYTDFVKYGNPTPVTSELVPVKWTPVTNISFNFLKIDFEMQMGKRPFHERLSFWDFFYRGNKHAQRGYRYEANAKH